MHVNVATYSQFDSTYTNRCVDYLVSIKPWEIKVGHRAIDLHLFIRSHSTYLSYTSDYLIFTNQNLLSVPINSTA
jgi:hypothetical protein